MASTPCDQSLAVRANAVAYFTGWFSKGKGEKGQNKSSRTLVAVCTTRARGTPQARRSHSN